MRCRAFSSARGVPRVGSGVHRIGTLHPCVPVGLLDDKTSWLAEAREYRNQGVHRASVSRNYLIVVGDTSKVQFCNPRTDEVQKLDRLDVIADWIDRTEALFETFGASLRAKCGLPKY